MKPGRFSSTVAFTALLMLSGMAQAHPAAQHVGGLAAGMAHPLFGWDHLAALLAIGAWTGQTQRQLFARLAGAFLVALVAGSLSGMFLVVPVDGGIIASLGVLGLLLALAARPSPAWALAAVVVFGTVHGLAHGADMPATAAGLLYIIGLSITSLGLMATGLFAALRMEAMAWPALRTGGALLAAGSIAMPLVI